METKQKFTKVRPGLGKNHYEKQLLKQHRTECLNYLKDQNYSLEDRKILMRHYDELISLKNIVQVHTHFIPYFWEELCSDNLATLIANTTCKS